MSAAVDAQARPHDLLRQRGRAKKPGKSLLPGRCSPVELLGEHNSLIGGTGAAAGDGEGRTLRK